jgi:protein tyrosine phosphatase (PTP) superfamily phosphohydrolase (DUF442 family)
MDSSTRLWSVVWLSLAALLASPHAAAPQAAPAPTPALAATEAAPPLLPNARQPLPGVLTGGQPSEEQLTALAAAGYRTVVSLRTAAEGAPPMGELATRLGMRYVEIPISGAQDLTADRAAQLGSILTDEKARPVVVHCAAGNRAGALLAIEQAQVEGKPPEEALDIGLAAGLTMLEPAVRVILKLPPAPEKQP